VDYGIVVATL